MKYRIENVMRENELSFSCDVLTKHDRIRVNVSGERITVKINPGKEISFPAGTITGKETTDYCLTIENNTGDTDISEFFDTANTFITVVTGELITIESMIEFMIQVL